MDFKELSKTDVTKHIEKKGKFNYLSWPYAVSEFRKACPNGTWEVGFYGENDQPYSQTDSGCFVAVKVWPDTDKPKLSFTQIHPVLNYKNQTVKEPNAFEINTSIQRCLVKAIALATGIGLHIYAGEDLPEEPAPLKDTTVESAEKRAAYENEADTHASLESLKNWYKKNEKKMAKELTESDKKALNKYIGFLKADLEEIKENKTVPGDLPR